ncbi:hypothetical protein Sru01_23820 [Sphaerisporangium rufum]|uniref:Transposase (putative) YhgA-like domain-containing protein n=1 Tax=Sphaerisporangium rufum TaxID=1381558 RepID=A0A919V4L7_9ACTN|nr:hypothetical protein [Sphaerisporangium rufum]GII77400.1 hypothetical protein Sru01_23820 [Sphaerisporangium rufum]
MPTAQHEALHRIFQERAELLPRVLRNELGVPLPDPVKVEIMNVDLTDMQPVPRWVDTLLMLHLPDRRLIAALESQTDTSEEKRRRWARYLAYLHDTHACDVLLLVICRSGATARWAEQAYTVGLPEWHTLTVRPLVLGPANIPAVLDRRRAAEDVYFAILSAVVHATSRQAGAILEVLSDALQDIDPNEATGLAEFTEFGLGEGRARDLWRTLMNTKTYPYVSELRAKGIEEGIEVGHVRGEAAALLMMLESRGVALTDEQRESISSCADRARLERWVRRAGKVATAEELFA